MRVLAVTNMLPTQQRPDLGTFVKNQIESLRKNGLGVEVLFVDRVQYGMPIYLGLIKEISKWVRRFDPDIVHVMSGGVMADIVTWSVRRKPTIITFHGSDLLSEHFPGLVRKVCAGYGVLSSLRAARRANGIVVVSQNLLEVLHKNLVKSESRVIPCGIDLESFKPLDRHSCRAVLGWDDDQFHVLSAFNTGNPVKRPWLGQAAVRELCRLNVPAKIHYLLGVPHHEVPIWLNACDVLLLTSLHEGSPMIVKEALACNIPVVSGDVGDVRERIEGINGCYLALAVPEELAKKRLLVYSGCRSVEGRDRIKNLSLDFVANRLINFYVDILKK